MSLALIDKGSEKYFIPREDINISEVLIEALSQ
jgi:hypothetical protein